MLEGSHGVERDAETAVALLVVNAEDGDTEAMWMLGVCCEFGMGMEQDVNRAEQLYERGAKRNATAKLLVGKLKNKNGRGCTEMDLEGGQGKNKAAKAYKDLNHLWLWKDQRCGAGEAKVLASMLLMHVPLIALDLSCKVNTVEHGCDLSSKNERDVRFVEYQ